MQVCPECGRTFAEERLDRCPECGVPLALEPGGGQEPFEPAERRPLFIEFETPAAPARPPEKPFPGDHPFGHARLGGAREPDLARRGFRIPSMIEVEEPAPRDETVRPLELDEPAVGPFVPLSLEEETDLLNQAASEYRSPTGSTQRAIELCQQVLAAHVESRRARAMLADIYETLGRTEEAIEQCQAFLLAEPTNARIQSQLERLQRANAASRPMAPPPAPAPPAAPGPLSRGPAWGAAPAPPPDRGRFPSPPSTPLPSLQAPYSGWAIAALASALVCGCIPLSVALGLYALRDVRERGLRGRELAIAALVIAGIQVLATLVYVLWFARGLGRTLELSAAGHSIPLAPCGCLVRSLGVWV